MTRETRNLNPNTREATHIDFERFATRVCEALDKGLAIIPDPGRHLPPSGEGKHCPECDRFLPKPQTAEDKLADLLESFVRMEKEHVSIRTAYLDRMTKLQAEINRRKG